MPPTTDRITCPCGDHAPHVTMTRTTLDGVVVRLWSDGSLTDRIGYYLRGGRVPAAHASAFMGEVCLLHYVEIRGAVQACQRAARRVGATDASVREAIRAETAPAADATH